MAQNIRNGDKVWVRILSGPNSPEALVPGIVTDARVGTREKPRSAAKGGTIEISNSVVVISYRTPPNRDPFYTEAPEGLIGLSPRPQYLAAIDGPENTPTNVLVPALRREVERSLELLNPAPVAAAVEAAVAEYATAPALAIA